MVTALSELAGRGSAASSSSFSSASIIRALPNLQQMVLLAAATAVGAAAVAAEAAIVRKAAASAEEHEREYNNPCAVGPGGMMGLLGGGKLGGTRAGPRPVVNAGAVFGNDGGNQVR